MRKSFSEIAKKLGWKDNGDCDCSQRIIPYRHTHQLTKQKLSFFKKAHMNYIFHCKKCGFNKLKRPALIFDSQTYIVYFWYDEKCIFTKYKCKKCDYYMEISNQLNYNFEIPSETS
jgi:hypothetical protein